MADKVKTSVFFAPDMLSALKKIGKARDVGYAEIVRTACREYIVKHAATVLEERKLMDSAK